jgi:SAM-dependent methyltransferase
VRERRLVFGEVAELYDRHRPTYPGELIDDLVALAGLDGDRPVLEVGAGTGKATVLFAQRGIPVVAIEPSAEMAAIAGRAAAGRAGSVEIELGDFEAWDPRGRRFPLLFAGQAWHWVTPEVGLPKARDVLLPGGVLAPFWNRVAWGRAGIREALLEVYGHFPELSRDGPMHPANLLADVSDDWQAEIAGVDGLGEAEIRFYEWQLTYSASEYAGLLGTASEVRLLEEERRNAFLAAVTEATEAQGEAVSIPMRTRLCIARRTA